MGDGRPAIPYYDCRGRARTYIDREQLHQFRLTFGSFAAGLARSFNQNGNVQVTGSSDISRLGALRLDAKPRDVYLIRGDFWSQNPDAFSDSVAIVIRNTFSGIEIPNAVTHLASECIVFDTDGLCLDVDIIRKSVGRCTPAVAPSLYIFRRSGQYWDICFGSGAAKHFRDVLGLRYLGLLISNPHHAFHVREMYTIINRNESQCTGAGAKDAEAMFDDYKSETDKKDDAALYKTYKKAIIELERDYEHAQRKDPDRAASVAEDLKNLKKVANREFGLDGRTRSRDDPNKKAYDKVQKAIVDAVARITDDGLRDFRDHLNRAVKYDSYHYTYDPESRMPWET